MTEFKDQGNTALKNKDFNLALEFYTKAVEAEPNNHIHYSNRSLCYVKLNKFEEALKDAETCIKINDSWAKGYQRKGAAEAKLNKYWDSFVSYSYGNLHDPANENIKEE